MRRRAFTLIELLVVIAIIALLISILLPSLGAAKEQANKVKCSANFHGFGQGTTVFAQDHSQHLPATQLGIWGMPPFWGNLVYTRDFIELKDNYGIPYKFWLCPSHTSPSDWYRNISYGWGWQSSVAAFQVNEQNAYTNFYNQGLYPEPWNYSGNDWATGNALGLPSNMASISYINGPHFVETDNYANCFANPWVRDPSAHPNFVTKAQGVATWDPVTRPDLAQFNSNPPIMMDATWVQNDIPVRWNHGRTWQLGSLPDPNTKSVTSQIGDVNVNVLFADGHVENKKPEKTSYFQSGSYWFY